VSPPGIGRDAPAGVTDPGGWRPPRWVVPLFALAALFLVPWVLILVHVLPSKHRAAHWDIAWAGFDLALALLLLSVAVAAWRRSPWLEGAATAAATLLFVDAWFDVLTSSTRTDRFVALGEAVFVELPLAVVCLLLARGAELASSFFPYAVGRLEAGGAADLTIMDYDPPTPLTSGNVAWHWMFAFTAANVRSVMVHGDWVLRDGAFTRVDEEKIRADARQEAQNLWKRMEDL